MVPSYLITYDLIKDKDYRKLYDGIKSIADGYNHVLESIWIIGHNGPASEIRDSLQHYLDSDDKLLVLKLTGEGAWRNLSTKTEWLKANL